MCRYELRFFRLNHMLVLCYLGGRMVVLGGWGLNFFGGGFIIEMLGNWKLAPESKQEPHLYPAIPDAFELMH